MNWISVEERTPEPWAPVLVASAAGVECVQYQETDYGECRFMRDAIHDMTEEVHEVTHWMPLPKPPGAEQGSSPTLLIEELPGSGNFVSVNGTIHPSKRLKP